MTPVRLVGSKNNAITDEHRAGAQPVPATPTSQRTMLAGSVRATAPIAREMLSRLLPYVQYHVTRLGPAGHTGVVALVIAIVVAVSALTPARNAVRALSSEILRAQQAPHAASSDVGVTSVLVSLPNREQIPVVLGKVFQEAQNAGVRLNSGHYAFVPAKPGSVARYEIEFPVKASYPQIRSFINATLTTVAAAGLDKLQIERKTVGDTDVSADIGFVIFVRGE
jgi:hypothetical protein